MRILDGAAASFFRAGYSVMEDEAARERLGARTMLTAHSRQAAADPSADGTRHSAAAGCGQRKAGSVGRAAGVQPRPPSARHQTLPSTNQAVHPPRRAQIAQIANQGSIKLIKLNQIANQIEELKLLTAAH